MKWVKFPTGDKAHAIFRRGDKTTACGEAVADASGITSPTDDNRCRACDWGWRRRGFRLRHQLESKQRQVEKMEAATYAPRYRWEDFDQ
jgi:hypothetical protein